MQRLSDAEVRAACASRGLVAKQRDADVLRARLRHWIALSLNREVPSSLLLLAKAALITSGAAVHEAGGSAGVKLAVLEAKARRYAAERDALDAKIADVARDVARAQAAVARAAPSAVSSSDDSARQVSRCSSPRCVRGNG